jgi:outer membrane immunogenic protein
MKKYTGFLLATAGGVAAASAAQAADLPMKGPAYTPAPIANWQGWYVGLHAGANWQQAHSSDVSGNGGYGTFTSDDTGFIGGGQIGYNWQHGNFVYGWEGDISGLTGTGKTGPDGYGFRSENQINWLSTIRGRAGLAVGDTMAYVTAGLAIGGVDNKMWTGSGFSNGVKSQSTTRLGWAVGGGVEHMWNRNWTVALEGLFVDLGRESAVSPSGNKTTRFSNQAVIGRVKVNYKW